MTENPSFEWIEVTIDCIDVEAVSDFWCQLLGVNRVEDPLPGWARAAATVPGGPVLNFQPVPEPKAGKSRVHLDLRADDLPAAIRRVGALGGACTGEVHSYREGTVAVMTDPEGTEFCLTGPPGSIAVPLTGPPGSPAHADPA